MEQAVKTRRRRGSLSREEILFAAMHLLDAEGESALTFVRLGEELKASSTAVYRHFTGREDITKAIAEHLNGVSLAGYEPTDEWQSDLEELAMRAWDTAVKHPAAAAMCMFMITGGVNELRAVDAVLRALDHAGLRGREAVLHYQVYGNLVLAASAAHGARLRQPDGGHSQEGWIQVYTPLDPSRYPYAEAVKDDLRLVDHVEVFRMQVRMFVDAVGAAVGRGT